MNSIETHLPFVKGFKLECDIFHTVASIVTLTGNQYQLVLIDGDSHGGGRLLNSLFLVNLNTKEI